MPESRARLTSRFTFGGPALFLPRARLYADCVELSGWRLHGRFHQRIPLDQILQVDVPNAEELLLWLANGQTLRLGIPHARMWQDVLVEEQTRGSRPGPVDGAGAMG